MNADSEKVICDDCVGDSFLKSVIDSSTVQDDCSYCSATNKKCLEITELASYVERAFKDHYARTSPEPDFYQSMMLRDKESDYEWEREGELVTNIIQDEAGVQPEVAEDLREILDPYRGPHDDPYEESDFGDETRYKKSPQFGWRWELRWARIEEELKTQTRFFNQSALELFQAVFEDLAIHSTEDGRPVLKKIEPGFALYRARVFQDDETLQEALRLPGTGLGPSPKASAGRMNAHGISVFYGSTSANSALAEVRPPVGSKVAIARFTLQRTVVVLDLTALKDVKVAGSIFDSTFLSRIERAEFLRTFCERITVPVMPEFETSNYLITQAIADYLASGTKLDLAGIIYPSIQTLDPNSVNIVLFHKAARQQAWKRATLK